jgi:hypothetical protein
LETLRDLNTPQEERTKFEVKTWNSNLALLSSFYFYKNLSSILDLSSRKLRSNPSSSSDSKVTANRPKKNKPKLGLTPKMELGPCSAPFLEKKTVSSFWSQAKAWLHHFWDKKSQALTLL